MASPDFSPTKDLWRELKLRVAKKPEGFSVSVQRRRSESRNV